MRAAWQTVANLAPFDRCLAIVLGHEGNDIITDDPRDPGGLTRYGISAASHPNVDVRHLTRDLAAEIYRSNYWRPLQCDEMPGPLALCLFDCGVNQGVNAASRMIQGAIGVTVDGNIGPKTLAAVYRMPVTRLIRVFMTARTRRYIETGGFATYGRGWIARAIDITAEAVEWASELKAKPAGGTTGDWHGTT